MAKFNYERSSKGGISASRAEDNLEEGDTIAGVDLVIDEDEINNETGSVFIVYQPDEKTFYLTRGPGKVEAEYDSTLNVPLGQANGIAPLDSNAEVPSQFLPVTGGGGVHPVEKGGTDSDSWAVNLDDAQHVRLLEDGGDLRVVGESSDTDYRTVMAEEFIESSSFKYKEKIEDLDINPDELAESLRPVRFERNGKENIGLIAEEVEDICPDLVVEKQGEKAVRYGKLSVVLLQGYEKLQNRVKELEDEVSKIKDLLD